MIDYASTKEIIHQSEFLSEDDASFIDLNIQDIQHNWEKRQVFRTETEMRVSVLNDVKFPTPASKYWQSIREQAVFYENLVALSFEYRRNKIKQEKIRRKLDKVTDELKIAELQIDLEELQFSQLNMEQTAKDRMREIRLWAKIMDECLAADQEFDSENVDNHQFVSYMLRWHHQMKELDNSESSISERNNLVGQYATALSAAYKRNVILPEVVKQDAIKLGIPVFTAGPQLEQDTGKIQKLSNVTFNLNGITAG